MGKAFYSLNGHEVKIVHVEAVSNGQLVVRLHCCNNPETEHRHTIDRLHEMTPEKINASLQIGAEYVANQHASLEAAKAHIQSLIDEGGVSPITGTSMRHLD